VGAVAPYRAPTAAKLVPDIKAKLRDSRSSLAMTSFDPRRVHHRRRPR